MSRMGRHFNSGGIDRIDAVSVVTRLPMVSAA